MPVRSPGFFPPKPTHLRGRAGELATLAAQITADEPRRFALVGQGGSGKSMLACALGHRVWNTFGGRVHWFRVGAWDARTLGEMLAVRFGTRRERGGPYPALRRYLSRSKPMFIVLDNHEDDRAMATLLDELATAPVTWVITARRCLLSGVWLFPVTPPLATAGRAAFPRVAKLTRLLRYNPLALAMSDALVSTRAVTVRELGEWLVSRGVTRVKAIAHEDDLPEVSLLIDFAFARLGANARRLLAVLAHVGGDHVGIDSLFELAGAARSGPRALAELSAWRLVQEPLRARYALHAVVRYALQGRVQMDARLIVEHYLVLLEQHPERFELEQTHFFAAMDFAHGASDMEMILRIDRLLDRLNQAGTYRG